jgi:hypothetical protein
MKRIALSILPILLLSTAIAPAAHAEVATATPPPEAAMLGMSVTPFNLVFLGYQGFLESEGIPKFNGLVEGYREGKVKAQDLVRAAINMGRLSASTLNDQNFIGAVDWELRRMNEIDRS